MRGWIVVGIVALIGAPLSGQDHANMDHAAHQAMMRDSSFRALQQRGGVYMGVDQEKSAHRFDSYPDGGRIQLVSTTGDSAAIAAIRQHFETIAGQFQAGDFQTPFAVHDEKVPGTDVMAARRSAIRFELERLPGGAALRLRTTDAAVVRAIHQFMAYQRREHRSPGDE